MATMKKSDSNGTLEAAMALLVHNQAALVAQHTSFLTEMAATNKRIDEGFAEDRQRFARVEKDLEQIKAILLRHEQMLSELPEAFGKKSGSKPNKT